MAREKGWKVDIEGFEKALQEQKNSFPRSNRY